MPAKPFYVRVTGVPLIKAAHFAVTSGATAKFRLNAFVEG